MNDRRHWENCITHEDADAKQFIRKYFTDQDRKCLLIGGAGFDPRSCTIATQLSDALKTRLQAVFFREERPKADSQLKKAADSNEAILRSNISNINIEHIDIFAEDQAAVGSVRAIRKLNEYYQDPTWLNGITDVVLDMSALSIGISYPIARFLLEICEQTSSTSFHLMTAYNPDLDERIKSEPHDTVKKVHSFPSEHRFGEVTDDVNSGLVQEPARVWLPQLAENKLEVLNTIKASITDTYRVCPILPFPAQNPKAADRLIEKFTEALSDGWNVDTRDFLYVSERNPLDSFRRISDLKERYDRATDEIFDFEMVLSPLGSKVVSMGILLAAIKHDLTVKYVETLRYKLSVDQETQAANDGSSDNMVHVWLHGPIYDGYGKGKPAA